MRITGERRVAAERREVFEALRDHGVIARCLPAAVRYEPEGGEAARLALAPRIGPVKAEIAGRVVAGLAHAPDRFRLEGESVQGPAGIARGTADVRLEEEGRETVVRYAIDAQVGGKLAQLGPAAVESAARRLVDEFAERLDFVLQERRRPRMVNEALYPYETRPTATATATTGPAPAAGGGGVATAAGDGASRPWLWGVAAFAVVLVLLLAFS